MRDRLRGLFDIIDDPRVRRTALIVAILLFAAGAVLSVRARPDLLTRLDGFYVVLSALAVPLRVVITAIGFLLTAWMVRAPVGLRKAVEVTLLGWAANILPLPGAAMLKVAALRSAGTRIRIGTAVTAASGLLWFGTTLFAAGAMLAAGNELSLVAVLFLGSGASLLVAGFAGCWWLSSRRLLPGVLMLMHSLARLALTAVQFWLCVKALGEEATFAQTIVIAVSTSVASLVAVAPGGLGVRELLAAALASLVGLSAPLAFLATALTRLIGLMVSMPLAAWLAFSQKAQPGTPGSARASDNGP